ncbi:MAG: hypothetical protein IJD14_04845 [Christensenellaceae bacterium]|nr:hypothetical protein [Christensenellaceae bacterium]
MEETTSIFEFDPADLGMEETAEETEEMEETEEAEEAEETEETEETGDEEESGDEEADDGKTGKSKDQAEEGLEVKYNGELKKLTRDEAITYAQKGMNYDKLKERLDGYEEQGKLINELAKVAGESPEDFLKNLNDRLYVQQIKKRAQELSEKYGVQPEKAEALAKEIFESEKTRTADADRIEQLKGDNIVLRAREAAQKKWSEFAKAHPEITDYDLLPDEVQQAVKDGKDLDDAYNAWELKQLKEKQQKAEKTKENRKKSPKSAKNKEGAEEVADDFLKGFLGL